MEDSGIQPQDLPSDASTATADRLFPPDPPDSPRPEPPVTPLAFRALGGELFVISLVNLLLSVITLGIYYPWGRARVLRYMIGSVEVDGDRFAFHGTGRELFFGMLKVSLFFLVPLFALFVFASWPTAPQELRTIATLILWGGVIALTAFASVGSYRYRLSRTSWRAIRFSFRGATSEFAREYCVRSVLNIVTLGIATPHFATWLRRYLVTNTRYGTEPFRFDAEPGDLYRRFAIAVLLALPTLGLSLGWYHGEQERHFWNHTSFGDARFHCDFSGMGWLGLHVGFALIAAISFGLAIPWVKVGALTYLFEHLRLEGPLDLARIRQDAQYAPATGEELGDFFDTGAGIDIG